MTLTVIPSPPVVSEGEDVRIICSVKGTGPVTFKWYRAGSKAPLNTNTTKETYASYCITALYKNDSDRYRCEASNSASHIVSEEIDVQGETETLVGCTIDYLRFIIWTNKAFYSDAIDAALNW